jgi:hypothetical protein
MSQSGWQTCSRWVAKKAQLSEVATLMATPMGYLLIALGSDQLPPTPPRSPAPSLSLSLSLSLTHTHTSTRTLSPIFLPLPKIASHRGPAIVRHGYSVMRKSQCKADSRTHNIGGWRSSLIVQTCRGCCCRLCCPRYHYQWHSSSQSW